MTRNLGNLQDPNSLILGSRKDQFQAINEQIAKNQAQFQALGSPQTADNQGFADIRRNLQDRANFEAQNPQFAGGKNFVPSDVTNPTQQPQPQNQDILNPQNPLPQGTNFQPTQNPNQPTQFDLANAQNQQNVNLANQPQPLTPLEQVASLGLQPGVAASNLVGGTFESLTGQHFNRQSAGDFARTPLGKTLGLGTLVALAALGGVGLAEVLPVTSVSLGSSEAAATATETVAQVSEKMGLNFGKLLSEHKLLATAGAGIGVAELIIRDGAKITLPLGQSATEIVDGVKNGTISPQDALSQFTDIEQELNAANQKVSIASNFSPMEFIGVGKSSEIKIRRTIQDVKNKKAALMQVIAQGIFR